MADVSDHLLSHDADVTGSGATLYDNTMNVDINVPHVDENVCCHSSMQSSASSLSSLFSMIEYAHQENRFVTLCHA